MRLLHTLAKTRASFDDPNLVSHAGLVPVMALAQQAGLGELAARHVRPGRAAGCANSPRSPATSQNCTLPAMTVLAPPRRRLAVASVWPSGAQATSPTVWTSSWWTSLGI